MITSDGGLSGALEKRLLARPEDVRRLHRLLSGDAMQEEMILDWIAAQYGAQSLIHLPRDVAEAAVKSPGDFVRAAKAFRQAELLNQEAPKWTRA